VGLLCARRAFVNLDMKLDVLPVWVINSHQPETRGDRIPAAQSGAAQTPHPPPLLTSCARQCPRVSLRLGFHSCAP